MARRRRQKQKDVFTFRTTAENGQKIRQNAARDERLVGWYLRRLVERALEQDHVGG